ncbi:MAG: TIGR04255 family protein [Bacteroidia bacterium]|nr:TIGR04255 family protein [Bacteroidia bacterium]
MESQRELFPNNKITEALCQISFKSSIDLTKLNDFWEILKAKNIYTEKQDQPLLQFTLNATDSVPTPTTINGLRIQNETKDKVIQVFPDNISIHQVGNYTKWEDFRNNIYSIIDIFKKIFFADIIRIDLRTINNFDLDLSVDLKKFFKIYLNVPSNLTNPYNFNFSIEQAYEPNRSFGVIRVNSINQNDTKKVTFDISYVLLCDESKISLNDSEVLSKELENGHSKLNGIFMDSITEETKSLIK